MKCMLFYEVEVLGKLFVCSKTKGNASPYIIAQWAGMRGRMCGKTLRVGRVMYFINHCIILHEANETYDLQSKRAKPSHLFAKVQCIVATPERIDFHHLFLLLALLVRYMLLAQQHLF